MSAEKIFVGRKTELEQFKEVLKNPKGQAVLVVGQAGMGKTWLVDKMTEIAENHPKLKCGWVRYEVTPTDSVDSTMSLMMDNAFEAASTEPGSFDRVPERKKQWLALFKTIVPKGGEIAELINSLRRDPTKNTRDQFLGRLELISKRMPNEGRAIFVIDPEKYMQKESDQAWAVVVKQLPEKIKFVFAQRPEDVLVESETFGTLDNVSQIPEKRLDVLEEESVEELINKRVAGLKYSVTEVREVLSRYEGHPYAIQGSLDLLKAGMELEELPESPEPTKFAQVQWRKVCNSNDGAIELFEAYAVLEVGVPDDVVEAVSGLKSSKRRKLLADKYLAGLSRDEGEGKRIYHAILADYILGQIGEDEKKEYNSRTVEVYRGKLAKAKKEQIQPDALPAMRLAEHVLASDGKEAFVDAFVNECFEPLLNLGLLDATIGLSERALKIVEKYSEEEAMVLGNLGLIYRTKGDLDKSERMHSKALEIAARLAWNEGIASCLTNLGTIYLERGEFNKAEETCRRALHIREKMGLKEDIAKNYSALGSICQKKGDLERAKVMYLKALKIDEEISCLARIGLHYGNLGGNYILQGELEKGEAMLWRGLEIDQRIGRLEGVANHYTNIGGVYFRRSDFCKAEEMYRKALEIDEKLGRIGNVAILYGNLATVYMGTGELDKAQQLCEKAIEIEKNVGHLEEVARHLANLGLIYEERGDIDKAKEYWDKALGLYKKIGMPHKVEKVESLIEGIEKGEK